MTCKHTSASRPVLSHSQRSRFNLISGSGRDRATDDEDKFQLKIDRHFPPFFASKDSNLRRGNINQHSSFPLFSAFIFFCLRYTTYIIDDVEEGRVANWTSLFFLFFSPYSPSGRPAPVPRNAISANAC